MLWEYPMGVSENGPYLKKSKAILRGNTKIHWIFRHLLSDKPRKTYTTYGKHSSKHTESTACWCLNHHEYGLRSGWTWAFRYFSWGYVRWIVILSVLTVLALLTRDTADFFSLGRNMEDFRRRLWIHGAKTLPSASVQPFTMLSKATLDLPVTRYSYPCWRRNRYFWLGSENWTADTTVYCHVGIDRACKPHCIQNSCMPNAAWISVAFVGNQWKSVDTWW